MTNRANVDKQLAYQQRRRLRGDRRLNVWVDPRTYELWRKLHPLYGGVESTFRAALRNLDRD